MRPLVVLALAPPPQQIPHPPPALPLRNNLLLLVAAALLPFPHSAYASRRAVIAVTLFSFAHYATRAVV
jgi:hypothetical protein